jgi:hypothetical protein
MTDNTKELDIAQRIAEALARTSEPTMSADGDFKPDEDIVIGEVPEHLRHLHNLLVEVGHEGRAAERRFREAKKRHEAIHSVFFDALEQHVPSDGDEYSAIKICTNWKVVGIKHGDDDGEMGGLGKLLAAIGGHR